MRRWSLVGVLLVSGLTGPVYAQQPVYCPIQITKGPVWIDTFPVIVRNAGNGVALGVQIKNSFVASPFGGGAVVNTQDFKFIDRLSPGMEEKIMAPKLLEGDNFSASVSACVPQ